MRSPTLRRLTRRALFALALVAAPPAFAQPAATQPARGGLNPDSFYGKDATQGVSVRDSLEAIKKLEDARRMERLEDWNKAADMYQEVIEKFGGYVIPSGLDKDNRQTRYTGIGAPVQEQLAKWPKTGLDAYRNRYGSVAGTMLEGAKADDRDTLSRVVKLYFVTDAGKLAAVRLIDLLLEAGEFPEAASVGDRLLDWHPNLVVERPKVLFRTALAYHLSGNDSRAKDRAGELKDRHAAAVGSLFGKDIVLAEALDRLMHVPPPVTIASASTAYRLSPGGDPSRSLISAANATVGARMTGIDYVIPKLNQVANNPNYNNGFNNGFNQGGGAPPTPGTTLGVLPVADDAEMYFQDGSRVYAVNLQSGVPLPGWLQTYPSPNPLLTTGGQYSINNFGQARTPQHTLTLTDNAVLGVMGFSDRWAQYGQTTFGSDKGTRLVCLDRATGKLRWDAKPAKIAEENLRALDFSGSPLVVADNVYVIGRGGKNFAADDCYVLCFDLNNGAYKWSCFIASSNTGGMGFGMPVNTGESTLSHLAYSSGRVFVLTNLGACAALDAYSGTVSWLNIYPRENGGNMNPNMGMRMQMGMAGGSSNALKSWEFNPVIVQEGRVFVMPSDAKHLLVYDGVTGAEVNRVAIADFKGDGDTYGAKAMIAVDGKFAYLTSDKYAYCVDWTEKDERKLTHWNHPFPTNIKGRAFITATSMFVCTESGIFDQKPCAGALWRLDRFKGGRIVSSYPGNRRDWDEGEGPGNVLVTGDQVVIAGAKRVNVYSDMNLARKRLDDAVAAAPGEPMPRLRYAEVMFVANQLPVAMEKLDETVKLLGGLPALRRGPDRDHFFNDCLTFAGKLQKALLDAKPEDIDPTAATIEKLYDMAAAAADGDSQQVNYRMSRAKFWRGHDDPAKDPHARAAELYQQILSSPAMRTVPLADDDGAGTTQAGIVAEKQIADVKKLKPKSYEAIEKRAADALAAAGNDPGLLKAVADSYPNSTAAARAMVAAAAAYEAQKDHRLAAHTLRQAYAKYVDSAERARWLEAMARNYLAMPDRPADRVETAAARLDSAKRLGAGAEKLSKPLVLRDGTVLAPAGTTIFDALKAVQNFKAKAATATLPDFRIPVAPSADQREAADVAENAWRAAGADPAKRPRQLLAFAPADQSPVIDGVSALIRPPLELRPTHSRIDRVVAWADGKLAVYPVGSANPAGVSTALAAEPRNLAWLNDGANLLVWGNAEIALLDGANPATKKWVVQLKGLPRIELPAGAGGGEEVANGGANANENLSPQQQQFRRLGRAQMMINGQIVQQQIQPAVNPAIAAANGQEVIVAVQPADDKIIVATSTGQLFAVRTATGAVDWHTRLAANAPIVRLAATDDFTVAKVDEAATTQLVVVDTLTGRLIRRMPFNNDSGQVPLNFALAPDGMLVWIQQDRICGKNLFEPKKDLDYEEVAGREGVIRNNNMAFDGQPASAIYAGAVNPDQLLISEGRILVVSNGGKFISVHSLDTGKPANIKTPAGPVTDRLATTGSSAPQTPISDWGVAMRVIGSKLYVINSRSAPVCYNLDTMTPIWNGFINDHANVQFREPQFGQDYVILIDRPTPKAAINPNPNAGGVNPNVAVPNANANPQAGNRVILQFYSRKSLPGLKNEAGLHDWSHNTVDDAGISDVQGVDGGFYYLTGDKKLHFLKGARPETPDAPKAPKPE